MKDAIKITLTLQAGAVLLAMFIVVEIRACRVQHHIEIVTNGQGLYRVTDTGTGFTSADCASYREAADLKHRVEVAAGVAAPKEKWTPVAEPPTRPNNIPKENSCFTNSQSSRQ